MKKIILYSLVFLHAFLATGQGNIPLTKKTFLGALAFLPNSKLSEGYHQVKLESPNDKDPLLDPNNWYEEGNKGMRGMVGDAVLFLEWWTQMGGPSERYKFDWTSSGYFEWLVKNESGIPVIKRIDRYKLEKYPNLLKWFDNIKPIEVDFEFTFRTGNIPDQAYWDFRKRYKIMEDLGSAGYSVSYTRKLNGDFILYKASRKKQDWTVPGMTIGGWDEFLNMPSKYAEKRSKLIELFKLGETLVFSQFKISKIKWRMSDFEYIVKKFEDYESGKDKPSAMDEVAEGKQEDKAGDEFWDEADAVENNIEVFSDSKLRIIGLKTDKRKIITFSYDECRGLTPLKGTSFFSFQDKAGKYYLMNKGGKKIPMGEYNSFDQLGVNKDGGIDAKIYMSEKNFVKEIFVPLGGNGPFGYFETESEARDAINNYDANFKGQAWGFTNKYGYRKVKKIEADSKAVITKVKDGYEI